MKYTKKPLFHGYANQILTIDVGTGKIEPRPLEEKVRDFFIGGRGLGLYLLHQKINAQTKADDPANPLILAPGPLGGIPQFPGTSKCMAVSLSPLTHIPGVSNFGGYFGAYLKYAGFDALEITGISTTDAMIVIDDFKSEIYMTEAPAFDQVFDLEKAIIDKFLQEGREKKDIVFLTTGLG
ncbi:MAG TPA: aldehyde ferredoxin oxidoreductase N-terminal domain-containing protein, partial [Smithella sp.]|nr:aldehyde ferredoxin oxidoreductase N-terminal domain-containing protein [Smithella sp.]HOG91374.1 aldehyde ferredoxin oxidoreductase N-terminal domain-containing protein [Smithella sp.]